MLQRNRRHTSIFQRGPRTGGVLKLAFAFVSLAVGVQRGIACQLADDIRQRALSLFGRIGDLFLFMVMLCWPWSKQAQVPYSAIGCDMCRIAGGTGLR